MKFRFVGGLDSPDWILAEIAEFTKIDLNIFRNWCQQIVNRLKAKRKEWTQEELNSLSKTSPIFDQSALRGILAALGFILEKSAKNMCSSEDLEKEMVQLGMSAEHAAALHAVYDSEYEELSRILRASFIREPSLSISSHETQVVDGVTVHKLECQTSTGELLNLAMSEEKYQIFKSELQRALNTLEPYLSNK